MMHSDSVSSHLREYLTPTSPLGPSDAAQIRDVEVAARLFDPHNRSFNTLLRRDLSVVIGRRGSGKTALLNSYKYRPFLDNYDPRETYKARSDFSSYDLIIDVTPYKHFDDMQRIVTSDPGAFRSVEAIVEDWESHLLEFFFARLVSTEVENDRRSPHITSLQHYLDQDEDSFKLQAREKIWGISLLERLKSLMHIDTKPAGRISRDEALAAATTHLTATKQRALIVFDSMDEYDIGNPVFTRTLGALIRFIGHFNIRQDRIKIKLGLPSEIFPEVQRASANPLKDLVSVDQLSWSAMELAQIAAHRFQLFLELHDEEYALHLRHLDLNKRDDVKEFWAKFFPVVHENRYSQPEEPMTYVLRHTQLLPRQLLMMLQRIITRSAAVTGGYREIKDAAITEAVETTEPQIANEILGAFRHVYPFAEDLCKPVFANFPTVFSYDQLEDKWRKKGRAAMQSHPDFEMAQFGEMLIRMGIVGVGHDETDRYYEGHFGYDSLAPMNIGEGHPLCLHPIFSRHFNAAGNEQRKAIIPKGVAAIRWS